MLGALIIPTPNSGGVAQGTLPDASDITYHYDGAAGVMQFAWSRPDGSETVVVAQNQGGVLVDAATGQPLGHDLGDRLLLDSTVFPDQLRVFKPRPPSENLYFLVSWISYVGPQWADGVTPPSCAIVERRPDGGLFMAATTGTFDANNPAHRAAARAIKEAVAPLSTMPPWELPA